MLRDILFVLLAAIIVVLGLGCEDLYMTQDQEVVVGNEGEILELTASPDSININSSGMVTVLVYIYDDNDLAIDTASVQLTATLGTLGETDLTTDDYGTAVTTFTPEGIPGYAVITATYKTAQAMIRVKCFDGAAGDGGSEG